MDRAARLAGVLTAAMLLWGTCAAIAESSAPRAGPGPKATQLAIVNHPTLALSNPLRGSRPVAIVSNTRPITGGQTVLPVVAHATDKHGAAWSRVLLPGRPNGRTGWISTRATTPAVTKWQIAVRISTRQVTALRDGRPARTFRAVVGAPATPTPPGRFFVEETVKLNQQDVGAPYALALSARSNVLQEFAGGPGQIALHGTNNVGGTPGTAASHGCLRLETEAITWVAARIGPGVPVTITR